MSADFWAGYVSGAAGIILGNPLDILKVRLQASAASSPPQQPPARTAPPPTTSALSPRAFLLGTAAPVLGYGALNALLFMTYNRTEALLNHTLTGTAPANKPGTGTGTGSSNLYTTFLAGAAGGLATWAVSTPTELVKCRAQLQLAPPPPPSAVAVAAGAAPPSSSSSSSSWGIAKHVLRSEGVRGLYFGGGVTAVRDSVGYGFYFWGYELATRWWLQAAAAAAAGRAPEKDGGVMGSDAARVLVCGGLAGVLTWLSIFPLDVVKTRVQTQVRRPEGGETAGLLGGGQKGPPRLGAWEMARETYREGGVRPFFRGLMVCSVRAFFVNAVQWAVYEWIMAELGHGRKREVPVEMGVGSG
ncbi:mitochondrial carrier [Trichocladium antarcticum]|uniref:Mitochondrial carrier n=1 Tax=Trichocladium antarcticum TaxID=1450529 RepID=A0AAN6UNH1_9PEZI|nr:mitochondrial carrier [Trichocladium antarcticum]